MSKSHDATDRARKRALKVSARTLQRAANIVSETETGEPIVQFGSVRLVLPHGANHFRHLIRCTRCGRESLGDPVLSAAQLGPPQLVFCDRCTLSPMDLAPAPDPSEVEPAFTGDMVGFDDDVAEEQPEGLLSEPSFGERDEDPDWNDFGLMLPDEPEDEEEDAPPADLATFERVVPEVEARPLVDPRESIDQIADALVRTLASNLEAHRRTLASELERRLAADSDRRAQSVGELRAALVALTETSERGGVDPVAREQVEALGRQLQVAVDQISSLTRTVAGALEHHRREFASELDSRLAVDWERRSQALVAELGMVMARSPNEQGHAFGNALQAILERHEERLSEVNKALEHRLEQDWLAMERAVDRRLDERHQQLVNQLKAVLGHRLEAHHQALEAAVGSKLERHQQDLVIRVQAGLGERLDGHRVAVERALAEAHRHVVEELGAAVGRLDEHSAAVAEGLVRRVDARLLEQQAVVAGVGARVESVLDRRLDQLWETIDRHYELVDQLEKVMEEARDPDGARRISEAVATAADLENRILAAEQEAARQLGRLAERTAATGTLSMALLQATGERVLGSVGAVTADLSQLRTELALAQQGIAELRSEMADLRSALGSRVDAPLAAGTPPEHEPSPAKRTRSSADKASAGTAKGQRTPSAPRSGSPPPDRLRQGRR